MISTKTQSLKCEISDVELTEVYDRANGIPKGKRPPITTQRIFAAMRLMYELGEVKHFTSSEKQV